MGDKHLWLCWTQIPSPGKCPARRRERMLFTASGLSTFGVSFGSDLVLWSVCVYSPACVQRGGIICMQTCKRNTNRVAIHIITLAPLPDRLADEPEGDNAGAGALYDTSHAFLPGSVLCLSQAARPWVATHLRTWQCQVPCQCFPVLRLQCLLRADDLGGKIREWKSIPWRSFTKSPWVIQTLLAMELDRELGWV